MVEQQVGVVVAVSHLQQDLAADERESGAQFQQERLQVIDQGLFDLPLGARGGGAQEVEQVRVLEHLRSQVGVARRQGGGEVGDCPARPLVQSRVDLHGQHVAAPALLARLAGVPESGAGVLELVQQDHVVGPRNLCSNLLHN